MWPMGLLIFLVSNQHGKQNRKKVWNLKAFSLRTIKLCRFEIIDGVTNVYCIYPRLKISSEGTSRVCGRSLTRASRCFLIIL